MQYITHVRGVCAILTSPRSPFRLEFGRLMFQANSHTMVSKKKGGPERKSP
jgi:hypothetical protein